MHCTPILRRSCPISARCYLVGICGPSAAGKTHLAGLFEAARNDVSVIAQDRFYRSLAAVERLEFRHDNPAAIDFERLHRIVNTLEPGRMTQLPDYDLTTHTPLADHTPFMPTAIVVLEGHLLFHDRALADMLDFKIWVDAAIELRLRRRLARDVTHRGRTPEDVLERFNNEACPAYERFMAHTRERADLVVAGDAVEEALPNLLRLLPPA